MHAGATLRWSAAIDHHVQGRRVPLAPGLAVPVVEGGMPVVGGLTPLVGRPPLEPGACEPRPLGANPLTPLVPFSPGTFGPSPAAGLVLDVGVVPGAPVLADGTVTDRRSVGKYMDVDGTPLRGAIVPPTGPGIGVPASPVPVAVPIVPGAVGGSVPLGAIPDGGRPFGPSCTLPPAVPVSAPTVALDVPAAGRFGLAAAPPRPPSGIDPGPVDPLAVAAPGPPPSPAVPAVVRLHAHNAPQPISTIPSFDITVCMRPLPSITRPSHRIACCVVASARGAPYCAMRSSSACPLRSWSVHRRTPGLLAATTACAIISQGAGG